MYDRCDQDVVAAARRGARLAVVCFVAAATLLAAGCATVPVTEPPPAHAYVPDGYGAYFAIEVSANRDLFLSIAEQLSADVDLIVNRTDTISGGLNLFPGESPDVSIVALGEFPRGAVRFGLWRDRSFDRQTVSINGEKQLYFAQSEGNLQIAVPESGRIYVATGGIATMLAPREAALSPIVLSVLETVGSEEGPDAAIIVPDPGSAILGQMGVEARGLPVQSVTLAIRAAPEGTALVLSGSIEMRSEAEAALLARLGRLFLLAFMRGLGLDVQTAIESVEVAAEETAMVFDSIPISEAELVALIGRMAGSE